MSPSRDLSGKALTGKPPMLAPDTRRLRSIRNECFAALACGAACIGFGGVLIHRADFGGAIMLASGYALSVAAAIILGNTLSALRLLIGKGRGREG